MIFIDRSKISTPEILSKPGEAGLVETEAARVFYSQPGNQNKSFKFEAYKHPTVREAVNQLFHFKCAYCESSYGATQPVDVEHFRPKSAVFVNGKSQKPGYYWLAADWDNLLPSCIDCNRKRTQDIPGKPSQVLGKKDQFPVADEMLRAIVPGMEAQEPRLLINPCLDNPDEHLEFVVDPEKDDVTVRPALLPSGQLSAMGAESIRVYALERGGLAQAHRNRIKELKAYVKRINRYIERLDRDPQDVDIAQWLQDEMEELDRLLQDDQPYAGLTRQYIHKFLG